MGCGQPHTAPVNLPGCGTRKRLANHFWYSQLLRYATADGSLVASSDFSENEMVGGWQWSWKCLITRPGIHSTIIGDMVWIYLARFFFTSLKKQNAMTCFSGQHFHQPTASRAQSMDDDQLQLVFSEGFALPEARTSHRDGGRARHGRSTWTVHDGSSEMDKRLFLVVLGVAIVNSYPRQNCLVHQTFGWHMLAPWLSNVPRGAAGKFDPTSALPFFHWFQWRDLRHFVAAWQRVQSLWSDSSNQQIALWKRHPMQNKMIVFEYVSLYLMPS